MLEAIGWPLFIVFIWAALFSTTLGLVRRFARNHDQESAQDDRHATT